MQAIQDIFGNKKVAMAVIIAALGYFVDAYDIVVFSIVRVNSLKSLGLSGDELTNTGIHLLNVQMLGMLVGGIAWGLLGDKKGRVKVLLGSILLYSLANIGNAFVTNVEQYAICRFLSGFGLAGEIGAGITLVSELMPKKNRGYATMIVATLGVSGPLLATALVPYLSWQSLYILGGVMGLALLLMRASLSESTMFEKSKEQNTLGMRRTLLLLFTSKYRLIRFVACVLSMVPIWLCFSTFVTLAPEIAKSIGIVEDVSAAKAVMYFAILYVAGDFCAGFLSQIFKSRMMVMFGFVSGALIGFSVILSGILETATQYYMAIAWIAFFVGYWSVFLTMTAEQFGTNLRATVTTTAPNFVRASTIVVTSALLFLKPHFGIVTALIIVTATVFVLVYLSILYLRETYGKDLDYLEEKR